jgi:hypothetical protein
MRIKIKQLSTTAGMAITLLILLLICGCSASNTTTTQKTPYFPVQKEVPSEYMLALLSGKLVNEGGFLRVQGDDNSSSLIIWPYGYSLEVAGNQIWVIDKKGQHVFAVGDTVKLGGGFLGAPDAEARIGQSLPPDAVGPYFISNPQ